MASRIPRSFLFICGLSILVVSCSNQIKPSDFTRLIDQDRFEDFHQEISVGEIAYQFKAVPFQYQIVNEFRSDSIEKKLFQKSAEEMSGAQYYRLRLMKQSKDQDILMSFMSSESDYYDRVKYYNEALKDDVILIEGSDTLQPQLYQFVPMYGVVPYADFLFAFQESGFRDIRKLIYYDRVFNDTILEFEFDYQCFLELPEIIVY